MLLSISPESPDAFFAALRAQVQKCKRKSLMVFVHGYHVSFADAARRTAQMAYDLGFDGAPVFFSWPSQDRMLAYMVDEQSIIDAQPHLEQFLRDVLKQSNAENVYLIAHSMGSRGLARTLAALAVTEPEEVKRIKEVILAAPDIGTVEFTEQLVPALRKLGAPITLYASSNDRALALSEQLLDSKPDMGGGRFLDCPPSLIEYVSGSEQLTRPVERNARRKYKPWTLPQVKFGLSLCVA